MEAVTCTHCGAVIEGEGIRHRRRHFCSDECCEAFEDEFLVRGEPDAEDLEEEEGDDDDLLDEDLLDDDLDDDLDEDLDEDLDDDDRY